MSFQELHTLSEGGFSRKTPKERDVMQRNLPENPISALLQVSKNVEHSGTTTASGSSKMADSNLGFIEQVRTNQITKLALQSIFDTFCFSSDVVDSIAPVAFDVIIAPPLPRRPHAQDTCHQVRPCRFDSCKNYLTIPLQ